MLERILELPLNHSFFLFGPRQTGKSTLIKKTFSTDTSLFYDLLRSEEYLRLTSQPELLREEVLSRDRKITHVVVDEIQRIPNLLNEIRPRAGISQPRYHDTGLDPLPSKAVMSESQFQLGQRVQHGKFGEGMVTNMEGAGAHARVQVNFESAGSKWLVVAYANLQTL